MRKRGIERVELLLDATAELISEQPDEDVSLAQIAERSGVPLASIYHFFPNRNAALVALAQRYHQQIYALPTFPPGQLPARWQDVMAYRAEASAAFLNANPAALRLFMGAGVSVEVRNADISGNSRIASYRADYLRRTFVMAPMPDLEKRIALALAVIDGIWSYSYSQHRCITPEYVEEGAHTAILYLRRYLPEILPLQPGVSPA